MATTESASALVVKKVQHRNVCDVLDLRVVDTFVLLIFVPSNLPVDVARSIMFSCCPFVCFCVCVRVCSSSGILTTDLLVCYFCYAADTI